MDGFVVQNQIKQYKTLAPLVKTINGLLGSWGIWIALGPTSGRWASHHFKARRS